MDERAYRLKWLVVAFAAIAGLPSLLRVAVPAGQSEPPGEEVMRPTRGMLTASPEWIEPMMQLVIQETGRANVGESLSDGTKQRLAESMTRHTIELARSNGHAAQSFMEYFIDTAIEHDGPRNFDAATGQEFARRFLPVAGPLRGYFDAVIRDSREFATPQEAEEIEEWLGGCRRVVEATERRMQGWVQGDVDPDGMPFDLAAFEHEPASFEREAQREQQRRLRRARWRAERDLRDFSPEAWTEFIRNSSRAFGFDEEQKRQAEALRREFTAKAEAITTAEWREKIIANRMQSSALSENEGRDHFGPWLFRLDKEFRAQIKPLNDVGNAFRAAVIGLASPEQHRAALERTRAAAARHGANEKELATIEAVLMSVEAERGTNAPQQE